MNEAKGLDNLKTKKEEGERRSANLEEKMLINKCQGERQTPRRRKGPLEASTLHHRGAPVTKVTSEGKWSLFRKLYLDSGIHLKK